MKVEISDHGKKVCEGKFVDGRMYSSPIILGGSSTCTFAGSLQCVDDRIVAMNCVAYIICVATAPVCYAQLWVSCIHDNCYKD